MAELPACPSCRARLEQDHSGVVCREGHRYTELGLALATNIAAVNALWRAIRALEDDAAGLEWLTGRAAVDAPRALAQRREAREARQAAASLRAYAEQAQQRLDALPVALRAAGDEGRPRPQE